MQIEFSLVMESNAWQQFSSIPYDPPHVIASRKCIFHKGPAASRYSLFSPPFPSFSPPPSRLGAPVGIMNPDHPTFLSSLLLLCFVLLFSLSASPASGFAVQIPPEDLLLPSDAVSLLSFKSKADLNNKLLYTLNERFDYCQWQGVKCVQGRVVRLVLQSFGLRGMLAPNTVSQLDQLRILSLHNNSLEGPIPDLSRLFNLKSLFLGRNSFVGSFPPSILTLHRLQTLDLSYNNFTGPLPGRLSSLDRLITLRLEWNGFNGSIPPLNQSFLEVFNVTGNNLTGQIPVTPTLLRFNTSSFFWNPDLCGEIVNKACRSPAPFFEASNATPPSIPSVQSAQSQDVLLSPVTHVKHKETGMILGLSVGAAVLIAGVLCFYVAARTQRGQTASKRAMPQFETETTFSTASAINDRVDGNGEFQVKVKESEQMPKAQKSGNLIFCEGEAELFSLEQLMRASAELLGRGTMGTTYKAVLCNQLIVTVKRLDATKTAATSSEVFDRHLGAVGALRHPNLVPVRAYFQAKGERLVVYDYQPNGSLYNLIHGSRSARAKPLHWTSCLKIAEDLAQGIAYIHQASKLVHGNLKSSNVLLGAEFEACLTDYGLAALAEAYEDPDCSRYQAPETRKSCRNATQKSDVYAFGVLLLELLTGRHPAHHPFLEPTDMPEWVRVVREDNGGDSNQVGMLTEVASICSTTSPEQRPAMWQVLKMILEIKESVMTEDSESSGF
ncbi:probable inactive receptor kinase At5g67200 [Benincasa hispida]|uniref:probable inactive receptor kinase At5g67200 n=1 Tax=Benincasa hispida TaxID=102211 RepID=UPI0018FFDEE8|nr:probable inactive receptor kinase At5g67200 [Benincasa hispida]